MKIKIINEFNYQTYPISNDMVEVEESVLNKIGKTKKFDIINKTIVDYDNSQILLEDEKLKKISEIKIKLNKLSEDCIQQMFGEKVPDYDKRKEEFVKLHNELRVLEGKEEREIINI